MPALDRSLAGCRYDATWGLCIGLAAVNCLVCMAVPRDYKALGKGYTKLENEEVDEKEGLM